MAATSATLTEGDRCADPFVSRLNTVQPADNPDAPSRTSAQARRDVRRP
jgi:hypothetical protein